MSRRLLFIFLALLCMLPCFLLSGCQATPENGAVLQAEGFLKDIAETPFTSYEAPARVENEIDTEHLKIVFDAEIIIPEASAYSIVELQQVQYTEEDYHRLMDHFCPGATWIEQPVLTKAQILEHYWNIQSNSRIPEEEKPQYDYLLEDAKAAPETAAPVPFDLSSSLQKQHVFAAWTSADREEASSFSIHPLIYLWNCVRTQDVVIFQENFLDLDFEEDVYKVEDFKTDSEISQEEAVSIARNTIDALAFDPAITLFSAEKAIAYRNHWPVSYGWQCIFTRNYNGLQLQGLFDHHRIWRNSPPPSYAAPWNQEKIMVYVNSEGVDIIEVRGLGKETGVLYENVALLPFDELLTRIEKQLMYQHAYQGEGVTEKKACVTSIEMIGSVIAERGKPGYGLFVPSWRVNYVLSYKKRGTPTVIDDAATIFNAIDGSYIEPRMTERLLGYD